MSRTGISSYVQAGLRFARRNGGKIALFTLATGSVIAASTYMRRQFRAVNESLEVERAEGARKLRAVFLANSQTVRSAFRALLPVVRDILAAAEHVDSSPYIAKLREKPKDRKEKQELWEQVKLASMTHLLSAVYVTAVLYSVLSLQMNLLARYTNSNLDAPVQALPSGLLSTTTSKKFLDLARTNLLDRTRVDVIVQRIEHIVNAQTHGIGLTERMGGIDIECLCANLLSAMEAHGPEANTEQDNGQGERAIDTPLSSPHHWLFRNAPEPSISNSPDINYNWLVQESLDLCEILDFSGLVFSNASIVLSYALMDLKDEMMASGKRLPLAHLLPRIDARASNIFPPVTSDDESDHIPGLSDEHLEVTLSAADDSARFAASVFLSGEKENSREHGNGPMQDPRRVIANEIDQVQMTDMQAGDQGSSGEGLVTNISEAGGADTDDLGLMFDIT